MEFQTRFAVGGCTARRARDTAGRNPVTPKNFLCPREPVRHFFPHVRVRKEFLTGHLLFQLAVFESDNEEGEQSRPRRKL